MFSKACVYAFRATTLIALNSARGNRLSLDQIADRTASPRAFTAKVLQQLAKAGLIRSYKGPNGGFELPEELARKVTLSRIVELMDGDPIHRGCAMGLEACDAKKPCPMHEQFSTIRDELRTMLEHTHVHGLTLGLMQGKTHLKR